MVLQNVSHLQGILQQVLAVGIDRHDPDVIAKITTGMIKACPEEFEGSNRSALNLSNVLTKEIQDIKIGLPLDLQELLNKLKKA